MYLEEIITYLLPANSISFVLGNLRWYFLYWELKVFICSTIPLCKTKEPNKLSCELQKLPLVLPREKRRRARDCIIVRKAKKKNFFSTTTLCLWSEELLCRQENNWNLSVGKWIFAWLRYQKISYSRKFRLEIHAADFVDICTWGHFVLYYRLETEA